MKIVLDAFGGDNAPSEIVKGGIIALNNDKELQLVMVGKEEEIKSLLTANNADLSRVEVINATEVISMEEVPTVAIRKKKDSSMVKAFDTLMARDDIDGIVSAGSTGAFLTGAVLKVGRIKKINRPALCPILPKLTEKGGGVLLLDCGANVDCKPLNLCQFALMGKCYAEAFLGINNPRVGLLNIGVEDHKGGVLQQETYQLLKDMNINFVGNIEARNMLEDVCDVIVSDGYSGNIALKASEGMAINLLNTIKSQLKNGNLKTKIGGLLVKDALHEFKDKFGKYLISGAGFIGVNKVVVKAHGSSKADAIAMAISQASVMAKQNMIEKIKEALEKEEL